MKTMLRMTICCFAICLGNAAGLGAGLPVAKTLGGGRFDPWNKEKWAAWYDSSGRLARSFIMDTSVEFADDGNGRPVTWAPEFADKQRNLFEILKNANYAIDGRGTTIDASKPSMRGPVSSLYAKAAPSSDGSRPLLREADWNPAKVGILIHQPSATTSDGTTICNFVLIGFSRAIETHHAHKRRVTVEHCDVARSSIAVFARGQNVTVRECVLRESMNCAVYGEYGSRGWSFEKCRFSDNSVNAGAQTFGDMVIDACYEYTITRNNFSRPAVPDRRVPAHRTAISIFRNSGEAGDIREHAAHHVEILDNVFEAYHIAVDIGARAGVVDVKDRSLEGRCYTHDITVKNNTFDDCRVGIKINTDQNYIINNTFSKCDRDIVVHCVFYKALNEYITQEGGGAGVWLWSLASDTRGFSDYCSYQSRESPHRVYDKIRDEDRVFHIVTKGNVALNPPRRNSFKATIVREESLVAGLSFREALASGARPVDIAVANYVDHLPGDEIAVIWDSPVSNIDGKDFYTIIIYDQRGIELDRCGRSPVRWKAIAGGNLVPGKGWIHVNSEAEIAAVADGPDAAGKYPVFIFRRGFGLDILNLKDEGVLRLGAGNTRPWHDISIGDFTPGGPYLEIAAIPAPSSGGADGSQKIYYFDSRSPDWVGETDALPLPLNAITAGNFDPAAPGDEVAGIGVPGERPSPIYLFKPGAHGAYQAVPGSEGRWAALAAGKFAGDSPAVSELASASLDREGGVFPVKFFRLPAGLYKTHAGPELNTPARALDNGIAATEYASGGQPAGPAPVRRDDVALLPSAPPAPGTPLLWISAARIATGDDGAPVRVTPLYR
jgi:parallel beta-helix repeat protein